MTDAYAETDVWPNPPATHAPAPDRTERAPAVSRVLGDVPTATDAREAAYAEAICGCCKPEVQREVHADQIAAVVAVADAELAEQGDRIREHWAGQVAKAHRRAEAAEAAEAERDTYREQWHQEVENFERETVRAEAAEARLRAVEALADEWTQEAAQHNARGRAYFDEGKQAESIAEAATANAFEHLIADLRASLASAAPAVSDANECYGDQPLCEAHRSPWDGRGRCHAVSDGEGATSEACPACHHIHAPEGCTGPPSPSDLWAGVSPEGCDCEFNPASPVVAPSATETPQAPAEQECEHVWQVEYLPDPMSAGSVVESGDDFCTECYATRRSLAPSARPDTADDEGGTP